MKNQDVTFIRKNGRIIPIKRKRNQNPKRSFTEFGLIAGAKTGAVIGATKAIMGNAKQKLSSKKGFSIARSAGKSALLLGGAGAAIGYFSSPNKKRSLTEIGFQEGAKTGAIIGGTQAIMSGAKQRFLKGKAGKTFSIAKTAGRNALLLGGAGAGIGYLVSPKKKNKKKK